jgi:hypothetical protein
VRQSLSARTRASIAWLTLVAAIVAGCGDEMRAVPMTCDVVPSALETPVDPDQLPRYATSPLVRGLASARDADLSWTPGDGVALRPRGPAPTLILPAPLPFGAGNDDRLVFDVTTARDVDFEVAWSDDACATPGPPCLARRALPGAGRHVVPVALTGRTAAPRDLEVRFPADAGDVTIHAVRAGAYEPELEPGTSAVAVPLVGPDHRTELFAIEQATPRYEADGLHLEPRDDRAPDAPYAPWIGMGLERPANEARYLVARLDAPKGTRLQVYFAGSACSHFMETCRLSLTETEPGTFVGDLGAHPWWRGMITALRFDVTMPTAAPAVIREAGFVTRATYHARLAAQTLPIALLGGERPAAIVASHQVEVAPRPDGAFDVQLADAKDDESFAPWLIFSVESTADLARLLEIQGDDVPGDAVRLHFTGAGCPALSEDCTTQVRRNIRGDLTMDLADVARWRGTIDALRIGLPGKPGSRYVLRHVRFVPPLTTTEFITSTAYMRGPGTLARLDALRLGWQVQSGQTLDCRIDPAQGPATPPSAITLRVPTIPSVIDFVGARISWVLDDGTSEPAAEWEDAFAAPRASSWVNVPLRAPTRAAQRLRVAVRCSENCESRAQPGRVLQVARPVYTTRATPRPAGAPRHVLLVSLDTVRADMLAPWGAAAERAPFLADLAARSTVYEQVYAVDTWTQPTHAAMLTGRHPAGIPEARKSMLPDGVPTLAGRLAADGWVSVAIADGAIVAPPFGLDRGFEVFDSRMEPFHTKREVFVETVSERVASGAPVFAFLHTYAVHDPYSVAPGPGLDWLARVGAGTMAVPFLKIGGLPHEPVFIAHAEAAARHLRARYEAALHTLDGQLAALFADPRLADFLADALVVVTSDHGEEFLEHGGLGHFTQVPYPELTHVPLLVHTPGQTAGTRDATLRSQIEIPGMVLGALGLPNDLPPSAPCAERGHVMAVGFGTGVAPYPTSTHLATGVYADGWELIRVVERATGQLAHEETLALPRFPNAAATAPVEAMRETATCLEQRLLADAAVPAARPALPQDQKDRLRALGYVLD